MWFLCSVVWLECNWVVKKIYKVREKNFVIMEEKLCEVFVEVLVIMKEYVIDEFRYFEFLNWDFVVYMFLIVLIEEVFDIMIDVEDVIDMSSFVKVKQIVVKYF